MASYAIGSLEGSCLVKPDSHSLQSGFVKLGDQLGSDSESAWLPLLLQRTQWGNSSNLPQGSFQSAQRGTLYGPRRPPGCMRYERPSSTGKKTEQEHLVTTAATFLISPNTAVGNELIKWLVKKGVCSQVTPISHADTRDSALKWYPCCHVPAYTITTYNARLHLLVLALCSFPFSAWI